MTQQPDVIDVLGVHHVAIKVTDLARSEAFYCANFGLAVLRRWVDEAARPRAVWLGLATDTAPSYDAGFIALERADSVVVERTPRSEVGFCCLALRIAPGDRNRFRRRFLATGATIFHETDYTSYVRDPDGNVVAVSHFPANEP